jgi:DeoR/GlpR family transcriptional regulator of sugar metabolism
MLIFDRQKKIQELLEKQKTLSVADLCSAVYASEATIRRDLYLMEKEHLLTRVRGGAAYHSGNNEDPAYVLRSSANTSAKDIIAEIAVRYIKDGMTLFMDSSSTVCALAKKLGRIKNLTVLTNGLTTAGAFAGLDNVNLLLCGGKVFHTISTVGAETVDMVHGYKADLFLFSCRGVTADGFLTDANDESACIKKTMLKNSKHQILLCDHSKLNQEYFCRLAHADEIDRIITDDLSGWEGIQTECKMQDC